MHIYIYIHTHTHVIHRLIVLFYHNSSVWLDVQDAWSWDRNLADFYASQVFCHTPMRKLSVSEGICQHETHTHSHTCCVYVYSQLVDCTSKWPEGSLFQKLPHRGVGEVATLFPQLLHFSLDPYLIMLSVK